MMEADLVACGSDKKDADDKVPPLSHSPDVLYYNDGVTVSAASNVFLYNTFKFTLTKGL